MQLPDAGCQLPVVGSLKGAARSRTRPIYTLASDNGTSASSVGTRLAIAPHGFTLVEVLISIGIALVLIVGISQIFALAQKTSGAGVSLVSAIESQRSIQNTLVEDMRNMVTGTGSPGLVIGSYSIPAFRNKLDAQANRGSVVQFNDTQGSGSLPYTASPAQAYEVNDRIHRLDRLCFFARGHYESQTADPPNYVSHVTSAEAFIWLGHLALPNNQAITDWDPQSPAGNNSPLADPAIDFVNPGASNGLGGSLGPVSSNDNNAYASDWILSREVILLTPFRNPQPVTGFQYTDRTSCPLSMWPAAVSTSTVGAPQAPLYSSRYDVYYFPLILGDPLNICKQVYSTNPDFVDTWWQNVSGLFPAPVKPSYVYIDRRYYANPFPTKPGAGSKNYSAYSKDPAAWMSGAAAQTAPIFVRGCSQFVVEYAGNFLTQNQDTTSSNFGKIIAAAPDPSGKLDFIPVWDASIGTWRRQIRWYGFPRDVDGDGQVALNVVSPFPGQSKAVPLQPAYDTVPLNDVITAAGLLPNPYRDVPGKSLGFEKSCPTDTYANGNMTSMNFIPTPTRPPDPMRPYRSSPYVCAWDPGAPATAEPRPKMIRIVIGIDDPSGRLNSQQLFEYVFTLPG